MYEFDAKRAKDACVRWIADWFAQNGNDCYAIVGISGGKDSSIVAALCVEALGRERVIGVLMPNGVQPDIDMAKRLCDFLKIRRETVNIGAAYDALIQELDFAPSEQTLINLAPRLRMSALYAVSQTYNGRVANTCNLSEDYVGYSTRYGDSAGDFSPLSQLTVAEVKAIGYELGLPKELIEKVPSDGLCEKTDEDNLGFTYAVLDKYIREGVCEDAAVKALIDEKHTKNLFKLQPIPCFDPGILKRAAMRPKYETTKMLTAKDDCIMRIISDEEKEYLANYDIADFDRPSLAVDIVLFSILKDREPQDVRKLAESELKVLLIKRGQHPFKGCWALPGGFCRPYEDVKAAAARELLEETGVSGTYMSLIDAYGKPGRDPRGWIISNTYLALTDGAKCTPRAGTDAWESDWFTVKLQTQEHDLGEGETSMQKTHTLHLTNRDGMEFRGVIEEIDRRTLTADTVDFEMKSSDLAFDHVLIILSALLKLRYEAENSRDMIFNIMPETFTMAELKDAFALILGKPLIRANFNRDMMKYVEETGDMTGDVGHRPAKIYRRKME